MPREKKYQHERIRDWMLSQNDWKTLAEIRTALGYPETSISAELRNLRKAQFGSYRVEKRRRYSGDYRIGSRMYEYRLLPHTEIVPASKAALVPKPPANLQAILVRMG